jgi:hypothetical protein
MLFKTKININVYFVFQIKFYKYIQPEFCFSSQFLFK